MRQKVRAQIVKGNFINKVSYLLIEFGSTQVRAHVNRLEIYKQGRLQEIDKFSEIDQETFGEFIADHL
jgi:hypothetical protein